MKWFVIGWLIGVIIFNNACSLKGLKHKDIEVDEIIIENADKRYRT